MTQDTNAVTCDRGTDTEEHYQVYNTQDGITTRTRDPELQNLTVKSAILVREKRENLTNSTDVVRHAQLTVQLNK